MENAGRTQIEFPAWDYKRTDVLFPFLFPSFFFLIHGQAPHQLNFSPARILRRRRSSCADLALWSFASFVTFSLRTPNTIPRILRVQTQCSEIVSFRSFSFSVSRDHRRGIKNSSAWNVTIRGGVATSKTQLSIITYTARLILMHVVAFPRNEKFSLQKFLTLSQFKRGDTDVRLLHTVKSVTRICIFSFLIIYCLFVSLYILLILFLYTILYFIS